MEDVIVVGAGPTGLWLAAELRLAGVGVTVLEARRERDPHSKALTLHPRTLELLACRGVAERFLAEGLPIPKSHFGGLEERLDFGVLDTPFPFTLFLPQVRTEELLERHAVEAGARVRRGVRVAGVDQDAEGVTVEAAGEVFRARYVVGCDGVRSTVRAAAGIDFPGTEANTWGWLGDVVPERTPAGPLITSGPRGGMIGVPVAGEVWRFVGVDPLGLRADRPGELTTEELCAAVTRITGVDFGVREVRWLSRFGNATRQVARYRAGRVLVAGDAAHQHFPTGGVGLNTGVQDAANLGWKLAAVVRGEVGEDLLDSYHDERHPVGAQLLRVTRAQTALMTAWSEEGQALRALLSHEIAAVPAFSRALAEEVSALAVAYPAPEGAHPLTGRRAPNFRFDDDDLFTRLRGGRHVLLDLDEVRPGEAREDWAGVATALIRPDGHVARVDLRRPVTGADEAA
ncbi:FAD-dependent monooxygenase [Saccharothrix coeruleofusca]|uniref:FAD-binding domain-containing protein n=1 Tax=Saccharothrix coeruleofusca TaxID=33919 RepID=A0A918AVY2_9PSEU|nr:FAD-dependent monooxygenase [Saccharothrix coeruleofusca]GGP82748.1 hypothetical protein GCM10010185_65990 [Saccharothrix coeruleofusca]